MTPLIQFNNVSYIRKNSNWRLQDITFELRPSEFVGIVGPNGAGKSTLLKLGVGVIRPTEGGIFIVGLPINTQSRCVVSRMIGYLPQRPNVVDNYTVEDIVALGRFCHTSGLGILRSKDIATIDRCLERTETVELRKRSIHSLSGGERQRVLLASVLAQEPQLLILDEPTNDLDMPHQLEIFMLLRQLASEGKGILVVTHDLNLASLFCDKVLLVNNGRLVKEGAVADTMNLENLGLLYGKEFLIVDHPDRGRPMVLPNPRLPNSSCNKKPG